MWVGSVLRGLGGGLIALATMGAVQAQVNAASLAGTWECVGPGQNHPKKPPIMWFGEVSTKEGAAMINVDGFQRAVNGAASVTADADGWMKVTPATGQALFVKGVSDNGRRVSMQLRRDGVGNYQCHRLPKYDNQMIPRQKIIEDKT
jgi:hypothetical protein